MQLSQFALGDFLLFALLGIGCQILLSTGGLYRAEIPNALRAVGFEQNGILGLTKFDKSGDIVVRPQTVHVVREGVPVSWSKER